ncbi:hypothetical protein Pelo_7860 [Pelomyxa schiedti]|nr:hypothetical protein Pelo_7860 [Pelomyxa schiedti]
MGGPFKKGGIQRRKVLVGGGGLGGVECNERWAVDAGLTHLYLWNLRSTEFGTVENESVEEAELNAVAVPLPKMLGSVQRKLFFTNFNPKIAPGDEISLAFSEYKSHRLHWQFCAVDVARSFASRSLVCTTMPQHSEPVTHEPECVFFPPGVALCLWDGTVKVCTVPHGGDASNHLVRVLNGRVLSVSQRLLCTELKLSTTISSDVYSLCGENENPTELIHHFSGYCAVSSCSGFLLLCKRDTVAHGKYTVHVMCATTGTTVATVTTDSEAIASVPSILCNNTSLE